MPRLWQLTRNRHARRLYERLAELGVTVATLDVYVHDHPDEISDATPDAVTVETYTRDDLVRGDLATADPAFDDLVGTDRAVVAHEDGVVAGFLFVSGDREVAVPALDASISYDGAYIWNVYVDPAFRRRGVATALIRRGLATAGAVFGASTVLALVAPDNYPSRRAFESNGFEPRQTISYLRLFGFETRFERT
ncbi:GNAT family N-acetyltransferase [Halococcus sp. IIIV-5B]|uniref:GNAT family N-acetyltransferase n=1 Tax=Halococcus sp. IIIV-5B TaxID=2321230 RepID=UPI000E735B1A|nr:GNAT family N-acetyltransferase [Halococcus sp. IIIV-5B]RJT03145.1 GNAT family N-acetyltransferase [Halococcus sp. IIIV-5B]